MDLIHGLLALLLVGLALALKPWRFVPEAGPPWPWFAWCAAMPFLWGADRYVQMPVAQPLSGVCLLLLMCGWPLTVLALVPVALATAWMADLGLSEALHRLVWLGLVPATLALGLGAAMRRWLPHHLMVYILARGFFGTIVTLSAAGALAAWVHEVPAGLSLGDLMLGRWLASWGDAWITGMLVAIFVAFRPEWLATYADRIYLPDDKPRKPD
ncbi:MAG: hypothetical protein JNJ71_15595 [Rubrivivax sp.]|nr:hypothetical protein [Rubrivivax sp.]